ncbi:TPA: type VI immunity family protein [Serratia fonticola]
MTENTSELVLPDLSNIGQLDQFVITSPKGGILARIVLGCELYFAPPDDYPAFYADLIWAVGDYYARYGEFVNRYALPNEAGSGKIKGDPMPKFWQAVANQDPDEGMGGWLWRQDQPGYNATSWQVDVGGGAPHDRELSSLFASMSVGKGEDGNRFSELADLVLAWCERLQPVHGSAGFCFSYPVGLKPDPRYTWALLQRCPGIDHSYTAMFSVEAGQTHNRIKGVNWLTVLSDPIVAELGGLAAIQMQLADKCRIKTYRGGIIIIAGPVPQLGDRYINFIPTRYQAAAKVTRPVRFEDYQRAFVELPEPFDEKMESMKWIRRFDVDEGQ